MPTHTLKMHAAFSTMICSVACMCKDGQAPVTMHFQSSSQVCPIVDTHQALHNALCAETPTSLMWAQASYPEMANWLMSIPTKKI